MVFNFRKVLVSCGLVALLAGIFVIAGCSGNDTTTANDATNTQITTTAAITAENCVVCHNDTTIISAKEHQYAISGHVTGSGWTHAGNRAACTNCHSSEGFIEMVANGQGPNDGVDRSDASPMYCRTCHQIHSTYTEADWALRTTAPVTLIAADATFDGGNGNLCASCHQPRTSLTATDGMVNVSSTHWGPHHGPQAAVMLGVDAAGPAGSPSAHYKMVDNTCAGCHFYNANHMLSLEENGDGINGCKTCHTDASNYDINGIQTEVQGLLDQLATLLETKGLLKDGSPVVGNYPEDEAGALWNYIMFGIEDGSYGVHNPDYTIAQLQYSIGVLK